MTGRSVAEKMGLRAGTRTLLVDAPADLLVTLAAPELDIAEAATGTFGYIHLFARSQADLDARFPRLAGHLAPGGRFWVSWPKGGRDGTDLNIKEVIRIGYSHGLVESTCLSVDSTWSALKFTHPVPGRTYNNSYGTLGQSGKAG